MSDVQLFIDDKEITVPEETTILEAAKSAGIDIPTLCYHEALEPYGGCRLCTVEINQRGRSKLVTSCTYPVEPGLEVKTASPQVIAARKMLLELLLARAPEAETVKSLAAEYGIEKTRFIVENPAELCILCGLCSRFCEEVVGVSAINFTSRGVGRELTVFPEITAEACIGCGACAKICPTGMISLEDIYGRTVLHRENGLGPDTAIRVPSMAAVPSVPVIDTDSCIHFKTGECKLCEQFCERDAIDHSMEDEYVDIEVGNIIVTTGFQEFDPSPIWQYGYGRYDNVITGLEFEKMSLSSGPTNGEILMADGRKPESIAILHCVGSRDKNYHTYCSRVCCMYSLKFSHLIKEKLPGASVYQLYIDIRCAGSGYEEFYERMQDEGVNFIRGRAGEITGITETEDEKNKLIVLCEDTLVRQKRRLPVDMVVLSTALEPCADSEEVARVFSISRKADGFYLEKHPKLDPVATSTDGIYIAGCCQGPKDIPDTVAQASAAAARVLSVISKGKVEIEPITAVIDPAYCAGCKLCIGLCPYKAIAFDEKQNVSVVNEALCKGCGICVAACPSGAITGRHFTSEEIMAEIEGVLL